jgi:hypothetical protein
MQAERVGGEQYGPGGSSGAGAHELFERDHELRTSLFGIEAVALALNEQRDRLPPGDFDQLALARSTQDPAAAHRSP